MKANEIKNKSFDKSAFGYKTDEVHEYLSEVAVYAELMERKVADLTNQIASLNKKLDEYRADEESMKSIIVSAQKVSSSVLNEAKGKAAAMTEEAENKKNAMLAEATMKTTAMISEAEDKSKKMVADATVKAARIAKEAEESSNSMLENAKSKAAVEEAKLKRMQKEVSSFKSTLLSIYKTHLDLITKLPEIKESPKEEPRSSESESATEPNKAQKTTVEQPKQVNTAVELKPTEKPEAKKTVEVLSSESKEEIAKKMEKENMGKTTVFDNKSPFKITITEKETTPEKKAEKPDFKSRFGELKFGENSK